MKSLIALGSVAGTAACAVGQLGVVIEPTFTPLSFSNTTTIRVDVFVTGVEFAMSTGFTVIDGEIAFLDVYTSNLLGFDLTVGVSGAFATDVSLPATQGDLGIQVFQGEEGFTVTGLAGSVGPFEGYGTTSVLQGDPFDPTVLLFSFFLTEYSQPPDITITVGSAGNLNASGFVGAVNPQDPTAILDPFELFAEPENLRIFIPAPGAAAVVGVAAMFAGRRRR